MALSEVQHASIYAAVLTRRRLGLFDSEAIETWAMRKFGNEFDPVDLRQSLPGILAETAASVAEEQSHWPQTTDCDRLDAAFDASTKQGILARHPDASEDLDFIVMWDELREKAVQQRRAGFVFYHVGAVQEALNSGVLPLTFGTPEACDSADFALADKIVRVLESHGLTCDRSSVPGGKILVRLDWKRRSPPVRS